MQPTLDNTIFLHTLKTNIPMSREAEQRAFKRFRKAEDANERDAIRQEVVYANLRFAFNVLLKMSNRPPHMDDDLLMQAIMGMMTAFDRFDETKGYKFISYAVWWIKQSIWHFCETQGDTVRKPLNQHTMMKSIKKAVYTFEKEVGDQPTVEDIAESMNLPQELVEDCMLSMRTTASLDEILADDFTWMEVLYDEESIIEQKLLGDDLCVDLKVLVEGLQDDREIFILKSYYGLNGPEQTLEEIGALLGITRERVRQLRNRALQRLYEYYGEELDEWAGMIETCDNKPLPEIIGGN